VKGLNVISLKVWQESGSPGICDVAEHWIVMRDGASAFLTFYYIEKDRKRREKEEDNV